MADHRKHGASKEGTYRLNARRGYLASAFQWSCSSVSGELGKEVEKGRLHSFPYVAASQERSFVAALLQTAGLEGANMDVLRAPSLITGGVVLLSAKCCLLRLLLLALQSAVPGSVLGLAFPSPSLLSCVGVSCGVGLGQMNGLEI